MGAGAARAGLRGGHRLEHTITGAARTGDPSLGGRFHLLAAHLEDSRRFPDALAKVPGLLPAQIVAMLQAGVEIGDLRKILPACRGLLRDGLSQTRGAMNYLIILIFVALPVVPCVFIIVSIFVEPRIKQLLADMLERETVRSFPLLGLGTTLAAIQLSISLLVALAVPFYLGGARFLSWLHAGLFFPLGDGLTYLLPWRRQRMKRDFAAMLGLLLDAGVPESKAVPLAASCTANRVFMRCADRVTRDLARGSKLSEAVKQFDGTGEFAWRFRNAGQIPGKFCAALSGWLESLDARAFQQEQTAAHVITSLLVTVNGVVVGIFAVGLFDALISIVENEVLW